MPDLEKSSSFAVQHKIIIVFTNCEVCTVHKVSDIHNAVYGGLFVRRWWWWADATLPDNEFRWRQSSVSVIWGAVSSSICRHQTMNCSSSSHLSATMNTADGRCCCCCCCVSWCACDADMTSGAVQATPLMTTTMSEVRVGGRWCSRWRAAAAAGWTPQRWAARSARAASAGRSTPASPPARQMATLSAHLPVTTVTGR